MCNFPITPWDGNQFHGLGTSDRIIQRFLRHSKATVAREHYIKAVPDDLQNVMLQLERKFCRADRAYTT